jgi:mRNA (guanine-N7-)-methyltransferase
MQQEVYYETQNQRTNDMRELSPLVFLKCFNNFIKSVLINEYTKGRLDLSVLDLCCGKGGDLPHKWRQARIAHYVGADLSRESIKNAKEKHADIMRHEKDPKK